MSGTVCADDGGMLHFRVGWVVLNLRGVDEIVSTFNHACPARTPGDQTRMYSVLGTVFQGRQRLGKKRHIAAQLARMRFFPPSSPP
jgi:hypothetical protein